MANTDPEANIPRSMSFMPMTPSPKMKREASNDFEAPSSKKRQGSSVAFDNSSQLLHVRSSGQKTHPELLFTEDDELVRSVRQQDAKAAVDKQESGPDAGSDEYDYLDDESGESVYEDAHAEVMSDGDGQEASNARRGDGDTSLEEEAEVEDDDDEDLFGKVFGNEKTLVKEEDAAAEEDSDIEIIESPRQPQCSSNNKGKQRATDYDSHHDTTEHAPGCRPTTRSASTPPPPSSSPTHKPSAPLVKKRPEQSDLVKDLRRSLTQQRKLHDRAKQFTPRLPLASHRYWICVLHAGRRVSTINSEKHFTWLKGNRLSTIATIHHTHATATLTDDFALLLGHERVEFRDTCEELDYFNDKVICLRAVSAEEEEGGGRQAVVGRDLGEGCPPEVIEIDLE